MPLYRFAVKLLPNAVHDPRATLILDISRINHSCISVCMFSAPVLVLRMMLTSSCFCLFICGVGLRALVDMAEIFDCYNTDPTVNHLCSGAVAGFRSRGRGGGGGGGYGGRRY